MKTFILAGSYAQARDCMRQHDLKPNDCGTILHQQDTLKLHGIENPKIIRYGTWYQIPNIEYIEKFLRTLIRKPRNEET